MRITWSLNALICAATAVGSGACSRKQDSPVATAPAPIVAVDKPGTTAPGANQPAAVAADNEVPPPAKDDAFFQSLKTAVASPDDGRLSLAARRTQDVLVKEMDSIKGVEGVAMEKATCSPIACGVRVTYPDVATFKKFGDDKVNGTSSTFQKWPGGGGRSGLVDDGSRLVATWFLLVPMSRKDKIAYSQPQRPGADMTGAILSDSKGKGASLTKGSYLKDKK